MSGDEKPDPELVLEARNFASHIERMIDRPKTGRELLRFTVTVPEEFATLGAWVMFMEDMRKAEGRPVPLTRPIRLHLDDGRQGRDWQRAKEYFQRAIFWQFDSDYVQLQMGNHPVLLPAPKPSIPPPPPMHDEADPDDIPF